MIARTLAAALRLGCIDELEPGFSRDGPIAIAMPTGSLRGESSVPDMSLLGRVRRAARRSTTAAGWPHDSPRAFGHEASALWGSCRWLAVSWACALALCVSGSARGAGARMGRLAYWRVCGVAAAVAGRRRWCVGPGRCPAEGQSFEDLCQVPTSLPSGRCLALSARACRPRNKPVKAAAT